MNEELYFSISRNIFELGIENSVQNQSPFFDTFFERNVFGQGIVFFYPWKILNLGKVNTVRSVNVFVLI